MHPFFGLLLIAAAGFVYLRFGAPLAAAQRQSAAAIPEEVRLRRQASGARALLTVFLVLLAAVAALFIAAGGPDSRGDRLPGAGVVVAGALLALLAASGALIQAEAGLWRLGKD